MSQDKYYLSAVNKLITALIFYKPTENWWKLTIRFTMGLWNLCRACAKFSLKAVVSYF